MEVEKDQVTQLEVGGESGLAQMHPPLLVLSFPIQDPVQALPSSESPPSFLGPLEAIRNPCMSERSRETESASTLNQVSFYWTSI